jgi:hypothetical protein
VKFCKGQSLYGGQVVAIDGTKVEAVASRKQVITPDVLEKRAAALDERIKKYLAAMDEADREETAEELDREALQAALAELQRRRAETEAAAQALAKEGLSQRVVGEEDARLMKTARHGHQVAYNAQTAVDAKHGLIVTFELTNDCNDERQLLPMAEAAKQVLEVAEVTAVADTGYSSGEQGQACEAAGITAVVPRPQVVNTKDRGKTLRQGKRQLDLPGRRNAPPLRDLERKTDHALWHNGLFRLRLEAAVHRRQEPPDHTPLL